MSRLILKDPNYRDCNPNLVFEDMQGSVLICMVLTGGASTAFHPALLLGVVCVRARACVCVCVCSAGALVFETCLSLLLCCFVVFAFG